ncbi:hypothetical protein CYY_004721 [Polysphondylium violaceum]|uniref:Peptidase S9 prolyl oligopeptidase catalytic domain-containing protein n=1 Tax=Polysphondylium violaceum TaxID=133409 RepID=A0A8J4Q4U7_9MYCE|nr:hypothetical protein CYY_004721 [Polysphondylium violaceum]
MKLYILLLLLLLSSISAIDYFDSTFYLNDWDILAPFPSAPREDVDVLSAFGGITNIPRADQSTYPSDLVNGGKTGWIKILNNNVNIVYNETTQVNWNLIESWAGESGSYFSGWGLSDFTLEASQMVVVNCVGVAKYFVDDMPMQGDTYGLGTSASSIYLEQGNHTVRVRIIGQEGASYQCSVSLISSSAAAAGLMILDSNVVVPDIVNGEFASPYVSIVALNLLNQTIDTNDMEVIVIFDPQQLVSNIALFKSGDDSQGSLQRGQINPINMVLKSNNPVNCTDGQTYSIGISVSTGANFGQVPFTLNFSCKSFGSAYTFTFVDFDFSIQYADATPPLYPCNNNPCPVLLTLHGASVDAKSNAWTQAYQRQNYSWTLFPTNRSPYGADWQFSGLKDAFSALSNLASELPGVPSSLRLQYQADPYRVIYAGHSMGGHGTFEISTHYPDRSLAVAVAAGWIDMQTYTPFFLRLGDSLNDPYVRFILDASISEWNTDALTPHLTNLPFIVRMGSIDDNVPPTHLRRMNRLYDQLNHNPTLGIVSEIPGEGHWFNGVVDDATMQAFFDKHVLAGIPPLPSTFMVTTLNPGSFEGKGGISILQLVVPFRVSKIQVTKISPTLWTLATENVKRFTFYAPYFTEAPNSVIVDGQALKIARLPNHYCIADDYTHYKSLSPKPRGIKAPAKWTICTDPSWQLTERSPLNSGPMIQILQYPLLIVYGTTGTASETLVRQNMAVYLANVLYYQLRYAITVLSDKEFTMESLSQFNVILFGGPTTNAVSKSLESNLPVQFNTNNNGFSINDNQFSLNSTGILFLSSCYSSKSTSTGASSIKTNKQYQNKMKFNQDDANNDGAPQRAGCMVSVIEGTDQNAFERAVMLFPTKSALSVPDYIVLGKNSDYLGSAGYLALGFWNNYWEYQDNLGYITNILNQ